VKLVQMPTALVRLGDADLDDAGVDQALLKAFRSFLPRVLEQGRGLAILAPASLGTERLLTVLARRIGAALRDENIRLRERGGDVKAGRKKLCYLPGRALPIALADPVCRDVLTSESVCFFQDLDEAWAGPEAGPSPTDSAPFLGLLDRRLASGRPTFVTADPSRLPAGLGPACPAAHHLTLTSPTSVLSSSPPRCLWVGQSLVTRRPRLAFEGPPHPCHPEQPSTHCPRDGPL
jgi:hypothetical protein